MAQQDPVDALFALPPEDFTAARDGLAKRLRAGGDAEAARQVRQLRRPTVPAWALNQLVRAAPEDLQRLLKTGDDLRRAQRAALSGAGGGRLREATARRRALLDELTGRAARLLADSGRSPDPHRAAIAATLEAATVDDEAADAVRTGRLPRELPPPSGFGDLTGLTLVPDLEPEPEASESDHEGTAEEEGTPEPAEAREQAAAAEEKAHAQRAAAEDRAARAQAQQAAEDRAAARALRAAAEEEAAEARVRAEEAQEEAERAEEEATGARERADGALEAVRDLERRLAEARREREDSERSAVDAESAAYRAHRAAAEAAKVAERARAQV